MNLLNETSRKYFLSSIIMVFIAASLLIIFVKESQTQSTGVTSLISVASGGMQGNGRSYEPSSTSADGRFVAFTSEADNLVPGNLDSCTFLPAGVECTHIFVRDQTTGEITLISKSSDGTLANKPSFEPAMSNDGRYVAFSTDADNLIGNDTNGSEDIFVCNLLSGDIVRVSMALDGTEWPDGSFLPSISGNGRFVVYVHNGIYIHDRDKDNDGIFDELGQVSTIPVSVDLDENIVGAWNPSVSSNGAYIAFYSDNSNLVNSDTNGFEDIFVRNRDTDGNGIFDEPGNVSTILVSVATNGTQGNWDAKFPSISGDGRFVVFTSRASNLVSNDTNDDEDIFVHDMLSSITERISIASDGTQANGKSYTSFAPSISGDGRFVTFYSFADNLGTDGLPGGAFVHDRMTSKTTRVSNPPLGVPGQTDGTYPAISQDGRYVVFQSGDVLVSQDTNSLGDVYMNDRLEGQAATVINLSAAAGGTLTSLPYNTTLEFSPGTFMESVNITYTGYLPTSYPIPVEFEGSDHYFDITAIYSSTGQIAEPMQPYTTTIQYTDAEISGLIEDTLGLYYWNGNEWILEESSSVDTVTNTVSAVPNHTSSWAVLGIKQETDTFWLYLPLVVK